MASSSRCWSNRNCSVRNILLTVHTQLCRHTNQFVKSLQILWKMTTIKWRQHNVMTSNADSGSNKLSLKQTQSTNCNSNDEHNGFIAWPVSRPILENHRTTFTICCWPSELLFSVYFWIKTDHKASLKQTVGNCQTGTVWNTSTEWQWLVHVPCMVAEWLAHSTRVQKTRVWIPLKPVTT